MGVSERLPLVGAVRFHDCPDDFRRDLPDDAVSQCAK
jgi:hypothetical protein